MKFNNSRNQNRRTSLRRYSLTFCILMNLLIPSMTLSADSKIYKTRDANGHIVFSDKAPENATEVEVDEPVSYAPVRPTIKLSPKKTTREQDKSFTYKTFNITNPVNDNAIRSNNGNITIEFILDPPLQLNHSIQLFVDGIAIKTLKSTGPIALTNVDRGAHIFSLKVIEDSSKKALIVSDSVTSTILRYSILHKSNRGRNKGE